jgi:DNA ligase (NAD+)
MDPSNARERIEFLTRELNRHNYNYYVLDNPEISDLKFDRMLEELKYLELQWNYRLPDSPTQRVGGQVNKQFIQVKHTYPMLSLDNTYSVEELREFHTRISKLTGEEFQYVCELKYDGVAIGLRYENGVLVKAVTRGDGVQGDDITDNIKTIRSIPMRLQGSDFPPLFEIRGEVIMDRKGFERFNEGRIEAGEQPFANPRNATSGSLKLQNSAETAKRPLDCYLYLMLGDELPSDSHYENLQKAAQWGFKISPHIRKCLNLHEVEQFIQLWEKKRTELEFDIDGIVIKVDSISRQQQMGFTAKSPRWAVAYKYKPEQACTPLLSVDFYVGRTGVVTPVANLKPVQLSGTVVKRASLHNADIIAKLDVRIGDHVFVEKGGEIIPKITGVDLSKRDLFAEELSFPDKCPECGTVLIRNESEAQHYCPNEKSCPPQLKGKIEHFISRKAMNIMSLGAGKVDLLFEKGLVRNVADLYDLKYEQLLGLDKTFEDELTGKKRTVTFQQKTVQNILENIQQSGQVPFARVLFALGIRHVGETVATNIVDECHSIGQLMNMSFDELTAINEVGDRIAQSITDYFSDQDNVKLIERLMAAGLKMEGVEKAEKLSEVLVGKQIVISGVFSKSRDEMKKMVEQHGGKMVSSISRNTDFVLAGENMGPAKMKKARDLGVALVSEDEFMRMIDG